MWLLKLSILKTVTGFNCKYTFNSSMIVVLLIMEARNGLFGSCALSGLAFEWQQGQS